MKIIFLFLYLIHFLFESAKAYTEGSRPVNCTEMVKHRIPKLINRIFKNHRKQNRVRFSDYFINFKDEIIDELTEVLVNHSNTMVLYENLFHNQECLNAVKELTDNYTNLYEMINNSGKSFADIGLEDDCKANGLYYLFLEYQTNNSVFLNNSEYFYLYRFLEQTSFFSGYCLPRECRNLYRKFFDKRENQEFFYYLHSIYGIEDIKNYSGKSVDPKPAFVIVFFFILGYVLLKILVTIVGFIVFNIAYDEKNEGDDNEEELKNVPSYEEKTNSTFLLKERISRSKYKFNKCKYAFYKIYKFLSIKSNLKYLYVVKNKYYNDKGLEYISFFRLFLLFWLIFNHNMYALIKIPHRDFTNYYFFASIWFTFIKYSSFASECWVVLDGLVTSYKLMSYLKRHNENRSFEDYSFKVFLKFYLVIATRVVLFLFIFFMIHVYIEEFAWIIKKSPIIRYFIDNINNKRLCQSNPYKIFIPFYIQYMYMDPESQIGFKNCYRFVNIIMNEFYCLTIVLLVFYFAYRFKSKVYDNVVSVFFLVNLLLTFVSYPKYREGEYYSFGWILGDTMGQTYTHLFINSYMMGILTGLVYYYYNDVISASPLATRVDYVPFRYTFKLMMFFDQSGKFLKKVYFVMSIVLQIVFSTSFYWYFLMFSENKSNESPEYDFSIKINPTIFYFYIYERKIFLVFFIFMILSVLIYPKMTSVKLFVQSNIFIPFSRVEFACLCLVDSVVYLFYSGYNIQIFLNLQNMFLVTLGLCMIVAFFAIFFWLLFEIPFRILLKRCVRGKEHVAKVAPVAG